MAGIKILLDTILKLFSFQNNILFKKFAIEKSTNMLSAGPISHGSLQWRTLYFKFVTH